MKILKVPFGAGNLKHKDGIEKAPDMIQEATKDFYLNESNILPILEFESVDVDNSQIDNSMKKIKNKTSSQSSFTVVLGGDHSITGASFRGFAANKENPGLLVFDAHPDLMEPFGTHEDYLRSLIEDGVLKAENIVLVGLRNSDVKELNYIKRKNIKTFSMKKIEMEGKEDVCDTIMMLARQWSDMYVSFDIDVLDPAFAPGTGYCEPGGLTTRELLYFAHRLKNLKNWKMADIVEVNPDKDINNLTVTVAAKLLVELS